MIETCSNLIVLSLSAPLESDNITNLGYFIDDNGNVLYLSRFSTSDVRADLSDETLTENYYEVFTDKEDVLSSISFDDDVDFYEY